MSSSDADVEAELEQHARAAGMPFMPEGQMRLGLWWQTRIHVAVALRGTPRRIKRDFADGSAAAEASLVERVISGLNAFDIRWKGNDSTDRNAEQPQHAGPPDLTTPATGKRP
jgi:hypothetical protein